MDLNNMVINALSKLEKEGTIQEMVEKQLTTTLERVINDCYGKYSPFGKEIERYISENINIELSNLKVPEYNALIAIKVKETLENFISESAFKNMEELLNDMLKDCKGKYTLSEVIEVLIDDINNKDELDYEEIKEISLHIEKSSCDFLYIYLDEREDINKNNCKYRIGIYQNKVFTIKYNNKELTSKKILGGMYGLDALMFKLYANKVDFVLDKGYDPSDYEISYSNPDYNY